MPKKKITTSRTKTKTARAVVVNARSSDNWALSLLRSRWGAVIAVVVFAIIGASTVAWTRAATTSYSLWSTSNIPKTLADVDAQGVEVGTKFKAQYSGQVVGVRFYKAASNTGTHVGNLWTANGKKLATVVFTKETASGWQTANFSQPVSIAANTTYVISYYAPRGHYSVNEDYFKNAFTSGPLTAPAGNNGVYTYGSASVFPRSTYKASNYWVDVVFTAKTFNPTPLPAAPTKLTATVSGRDVTLKWTESATVGIAWYEIQRNGQVIGQNPNGQGYVDAQLTAGQTYTYQVRAVDSAGQKSALSNSVQAQIVAPAPTTPTPTPTTPTPTPTTPTPASCSARGSIPGAADPWGTCWPNASNTGVPAGTALTAYTGSCTVTTNNLVIDAKTINCDPMVVKAAGVKITRTKINGSILIDSPNAGYSFTITDTEVDAGAIAPGDTDDNSAIGKSNFVATRVHTHGGKRGVWCEYNCTVQDSWIHGQAPDPSGVAHESGIRMGDGSVIKHNSILCDAPDYPPDAGCSANLTGYGDFAPIRNNTIEKNLFVATTGGACAYGGSSGDDGSKPYGKQASNIVFKDNIFQRGKGGKCGYYFPITDFDSTRPGNVWQNNTWDDGSVLPPAN